MFITQGKYFLYIICKFKLNCIEVGKENKFYIIISQTLTYTLVHNMKHQHNSKIG